MTENVIWAPKPFNNRAVCVKIPYKGYEISIALDDSCGALETCQRGDIKIFGDADGKDHTLRLMGVENVYPVTADDLREVMGAIDTKG